MSQGFAAQAMVNTLGIDFEQFTLGKRGTIIDTTGLRGTRERASERTREGNYVVAGQLVYYPTYAMLENIMPKILGGTPADGSYPLGDALTGFTCIINKVNTIFTYANVYVNKATFSGSEGAPVKLTLDLIGKTEDASGSISADPVLGQPFMHYDGSLTLLSVSGRNVKEWSIEIDNMLDVQYNFSQSASVIQPKDRKLGLMFKTPYTSNETDLYDQDLAGDEAIFAVTNGDGTLTFTFGAYQVPTEPVGVQGRSEITMNLNGESRSVSTTPSLVVAFS